MATQAHDNIGVINRVRSDSRTLVGDQIYSALPQVVLNEIADAAKSLINADSASIHVFDGERSLFVAGSGRATPDFLHRFPPRHNGIGWRAMNSGQPLVLSDENELLTVNPVLCRDGVRAMAAFPLSLRKPLHGVLYVHFWRPHQFSVLELELEKVFVRQTAVAIQMFFQVRQMSELSEVQWALSRFQTVVESLASTIRLPEFLQTVAQSVLFISDADNVSLYEYDEHQRRFEVPLIRRGHFLYPDSLGGQIRADSVLWKLIEAAEDIVCDDVINQPLLHTTGDVPHSAPFVEREGVKSAIVVVLKFGTPPEVVGLLFANFREVRKFESRQVDTIRALASTAAVAIRLSREYDRVKRGLERQYRELDLLDRENDALALSPATPKDVLERMLRNAADLTSAELGLLIWRDPRRDVYFARAAVGSLAGPKFDTSSLERTISLVLRGKKSVTIADTSSLKFAGSVTPLLRWSRSQLMTPLVDAGNLLGVVVLEHSDIAHFGSPERKLVEALASQSLVALRALDLCAQTEREIRPSLALASVAIRIQSGSYSLPAMLRMILTGVTAGEGAGFSRAGAFVLDETQSSLRGVVGIGPFTFTEAHAVWQKLRENRKGPQPKDAFNALLEDADAHTRMVELDESLDSDYSRKVKSISIPLEQLSDALSDAALRGHRRSVSAAEVDAFRHLVACPSRSDDSPKEYAFACLPATWDNQRLGVLVVDNRFLEREGDTIMSSELNVLESFAEMVAVAIHNARRWEQIQAEAYQDLGL